jgi:hypothetical protein
MNEQAKPVRSAEGILNTKYQSEYSKYFAYTLPMRPTLTRVYNMILMGTFQSTDNTGYMIGKDGSIFNPHFASGYISETDESSETVIDSSVRQLQTLQQLLNERGIAFLVITTPGKANYYPDYLPSAYSRYVEMKQSGIYAQNGFDVFRQKLSDYGVNMFGLPDSYYLNMRQTGKLPFVNGGIHWTLSCMETYINGLNDKISQLIGKPVGHIHEQTNEIITGIGYPEDSDVYQVQNAFFKINYQSPLITFISETSDYAPTVYICGGSFVTSPLLYTLFGITVTNNFDDSVWNTAYFNSYNQNLNQYTPHTNQQIESNTCDLSYVLQSDVVIIEFNQGTLEQMRNDHANLEFVRSLTQYLQNN